MKQFVKVLILFILGMVAIISNAAVWNSDAATFIDIVAGINLLFEGLVIFCLAKLDWEKVSNGRGKDSV